MRLLNYYIFPFGEKNYNTQEEPGNSGMEAVALDRRKMLER